jgi:glycosyltransferase involved in cell wall biosynthesis
MRLAIVHDELVRHGGAEQVLLSLNKAFPLAPIYTISYSPETTYPELKACTIKTSWFGKFFKDPVNLKRFFFPFGIWAMQQLSVKGYDVVLMSTTHCAKYVDVDPGTTIITYCHTPFRLAWRPDTYQEIAHATGIKRRLYKMLIDVLRNIDKKYAQRADWFITNSREVVPRIISAYSPKNKVTVINPPVKCRNFFVSDEIDDYYLVVSRFEPYKKVDLVIDVFNELPDKKLIIVGTGSMEDDLRRRAKSNISFLNNLDANTLATVYARCKAFIFPQLEDYGITPLEANAAGRPVIAYGKGGILDTMIPVTNKRPACSATSVFFAEQTPQSLKKALCFFETLNFDPDFIRSHAEKFDELVFVEKIRDFVTSRYRKNGTVGKELINSRHYL